MYEEYTGRVDSIKVLSQEIVNLWAELGTPQAQTDTLIVKYYREAPEQLGLHKVDLSRLQNRRDKLVEDKRGRERRLKELKNAVEQLWNRLDIQEQDRKRFLAGSRGCGLRAINEFEAELDRLNELKRQNLHLFVEDARCKLQELWDSLYFSEEEMLEFTPAFSDVYSDALLSAHEVEIARLEALKDQRLPTLQLIDKHRSLIKDRDDLAASSQDASRLLAKSNKGEKRDPTRLLREEKMRKRIAKDLPKVEMELKKVLENWEDEYGRPFMVNGERYLDQIATAPAKSLPPRSKTPSGPASTVRATKAAPSTVNSRAGSVMRAAPPLQSSTKTFTGTLKRNPLANSTTAPASRTPSRIPARVPLGDMQHGNNSPERQPARPEPAYDMNTLRKMGPPARAPPPKMRDLLIPPTTTPVNGHDSENIRSGDSISSAGTGSVRQISPEDVYDDRERPSYLMSSVAPSERNLAPNYRDMQAARHDQSTRDRQQVQYVAHADSRQISATSTAASGSENWETFDDASEPEVDATDAYYAKVRAAKTSKRFTPDDGYSGLHGAGDAGAGTGGGAPGKRLKAAYGATRLPPPRTIDEERAPSVVAGRVGSEAAWTDEDAF